VDCCRKVLCYITTAHIHTAALRELKFVVIAHPPYIPDLAPHYHLLVWSTQIGVKWPSIDLGPRSDGSDVRVARCWAKTFFSEGVRKFVQRCVSVLKSKETVK
jgi:hypothetical protein